MTTVPKVIELGFVGHLLQDIGRCLAAGFNGDDAQFWRRTLIRSLFGYLEAWMSVNRNHIVPDALRDFGDRLLKTEKDREYVAKLMAASDPDEWFLNGKGEPERRDRRIGFVRLYKANLRLALLISDVPKTIVEAHFSRAGWEKLRHLAKVRDRITHPHVHDDIMVTNQDMEAFK